MTATSPRGATWAPRSPTRWAAWRLRVWSASTPTCSCRGSGNPDAFPKESDEEKAAGRAGGHLPRDRLRLLHRAGNAAADDRLRAAGFTGRPGGLDARPRHGRLLQDRQRVRRGQALGQSHPRPHPGQHHDLLADRHRRFGGAVVLGVGTGKARPRPARLHRRSRSRSASPSSRARSSGPRGAGSSRPIRLSRTSTRPRRAVTSPPGRSRTSSRPSSGQRSARCDDRPRVISPNAARSRPALLTGVAPRHGPIEGDH